MAESESGQEKTEQPTEKRLRESRQKGQVARSRELNSFLMTVIAAASLLFIGPGMVEDLMSLFTRAFTFPREAVFEPMAMPRRLLEFALEALWIITPFLALTVVVAFVASLAIGGWNFSAQALQPKMERIDPIKGLKRIFALRALVELLKTIAKFLLVLTAGVVVFLALEREFLMLGQEPFHQAAAHAGELVFWAFLIISASLVLVAALDVPYQLYEHMKNLKMTLQEIKDEYKETEGKPEVKSRIRQMQFQMSQRRMMQEVPKADVIITNPTHYAVALRYDGQRDAAPILVAKGRDAMALKIREIGEENRVMIFESPPLARAVYFNVELDQPIPAALYVAVAQVLAYVFQLREAQRAGTETPLRPAPEVPDELWRGREPGESGGDGGERA
ncbi:MAG: flagellar biosynthesis protein FlhB [Halothiobacillaceae bacterium]|jgi:flagellar biosynthetic protein FlhB|nr:flagellar biosynthesis protein FlhB [Halothiobacillaceae bacterium]MDY0049428.1 flagellar biosynthesis protein FlhB [Halothiobacillaceae bacterium]